VDADQEDPVSGRDTQSGTRRDHPIAIVWMRTSPPNTTIIPRAAGRSI